MRQRDLEILLEEVPEPEDPDPGLEQVPTPAPVAAWLLFTAAQRGDVEGRSVADLGCGTGTLAIGAERLGAARVVGVETDERLLVQAREAADRLDVEVSWVSGDVERWRGDVDTVVTNPPFGARRRGADRPFIRAALRSADVAYSFHLAETEAFVRGFVAEGGGEVTDTWPVEFPVPHQHAYQREAERRVDVLVYRFRCPKR